MEETVGQRIKRLRKERKWSQAYLAKLAGCKQSSISELETGESKMPSSDTLMGLSKALNVSKTYILTGRDGKLDVLTSDETNLILTARKLTAEQQRAVYKLVISMTEPEG